MADSSTSVHAIETTGTPRNFNSYREYRLSLCADEYIATKELYLELDEVEGKSRFDLLRDCRKFAWFARDNETDRVHVVSNSCRLRWCPVCSSGRSGYIQHSIIPWIKRFKSPRFLTLTLKHSNAPLSEQVTKLYDDFKTLRKSKWFRDRVDGGIWFFQIKLGKRGDQWHPHLHCIIVGKYIPQLELSRLWYRITKSSKIVDIRLVRNPNDVAKYVARYCSRPAQLSKYPLELRTEIFKSLHGRRLCGTWGKAKEVSLSPPTVVESNRFVKLGSWSTITSIYLHNENAERIFNSWLNKVPLKDGSTCIEFDDFIDNPCPSSPISIDVYFPPVFDGW